MLVRSISPQECNAPLLLTASQGWAILGNQHTMNLIEQIRSEALQLGFDLAGIAPISPVPHVDAYRDWIAHGYHGEMGYMARPDRVERRENPGVILPGARAIVCVGLNYYPGQLPGDPACDASRGLVANYAWGVDYHDLMQPRLEELAGLGYVFERHPHARGDALRRHPRQK